MFLVIEYVCEPWMALRSFADYLRTGLGDGLLPAFRPLAWKGSKSGVKPLRSRQSWEMLWHFGQG